MVEIRVDPAPIQTILAAGCIPVIAPVAVRKIDGGGLGNSMLNVNADTAAGEIAAAIRADKLIFLTDVAGVLDSSRRLIPRLTARQANGLIRSNVAAGGMIPKLEACLTALSSGSTTQIIDGRRTGALMDLLSNQSLGTRIG